MRYLLFFSLDGKKYALRLSCVKEVVRVVETSQIPRSPKFMIGLVNVRGNLVPVINTRERFGLSGDSFELENHFVIVQSRQREIALLVDNVEPATAVAESAITLSDKTVARDKLIEGMIKFDSDIIPICNVDDFLSTDEWALLAGCAAWT